MNRHCTAINETSNKKQRTGGELLNLETIRRAVRRTTVFGERCSRSPLSIMIYYIIFVYDLLRL